MINVPIETINEKIVSKMFHMNFAIAKLNFVSRPVNIINTYIFKASVLNKYCNFSFTFN